MRANYSNKPLPLQFYDAKSWLKKLAIYYSDNNYLLPAGALLLPIAFLTRSLENIFNIYGNFPLQIKQLILQTQNPNFQPNEYYNNVYLQIKDTGYKENKPELFILAEALLFLRRIYNKDTEYITDNFQKELNLIKGSEQQRTDTLATAVHDITQKHLQEVVNMINQHCAKKN